MAAREEEENASLTVTFAADAIYPVRVVAHPDQPTATIARID